MKLTKKITFLGQSFAGAERCLSQKQAARKWNSYTWNRAHRQPDVPKLSHHRLVT